MGRKLLIAVMVLLAAAVFISGCGRSVSYTNSVPVTTSSSETQLNIAASFYPMYIMTKNVARDVPGVKVFSMTKPVTGCLHDYQMTPDDMKCLESAQIFVVNGAGMEAFLDKVLQQKPGLKIVEASRGIPLIKGEGEEGDNPHIWVSVSGAIQQVKNIGEQLAVLDPKHADQYRENTSAYVEKLESLRSRMHQTLDGVKSREIVTFHEAFPYFAQEFNLNIVAVVEREPGSEPSAAELAETMKIVENSKVRALFAEPQYSAKAAETIARETGAKVYTLDPAVTGADEMDAYIDIMDGNLKTLQEALN